MNEYYMGKRREDAFIREFQKTREWRDMSEKLMKKVNADKMSAREYMREMSDFEKEAYEDSRGKRMTLKQSPRKSVVRKAATKRKARISELRNLSLSFRRACAEGEIYRKGYSRKSHVRKNGVRVKRSHVKGGCIKSTSPYKGKRSIAKARIVKSILKKQKRAASKTPRVRCVSGMIKRSPYMRKSYVRKSGVRVKGSIVKAGCIRDLGKSGKGKPLIGPLVKGELGEFGYSNIKSLSVEKRHAALKKAMKKYGGLTVGRKLNALATLTKNVNPSLSKKYKKDSQWVFKSK